MTGGGCKNVTIKLKLKVYNTIKIFLKHKLNGKYQGYRECHIEADWLLIYKKFDNILVLILLRTGSHSELF